MEKTEILQKLEGIIKNLIRDNSDFVIDENTKTSNIKGWDSFSHINIIREIEKTFNVRFSIGEVVTIKTISDIIKLIEQKVK